MEQPTVKTTMKDEKAGVTWCVIAYRAVSQGEMVAAIRHYLASKKTRKPKRGQAITIVSIIGYDE